jgi:hypothetical protein
MSTHKKRTARWLILLVVVPGSTACLTSRVGMAAEQPVLNSQQVATLNSLRPVTCGGMASPLFLMTYAGDYGLDEYLESGSSNETELRRFLERRFPLAARSVAREGGGEGCTCFTARNERGQVVYGRNLDLPGYHPGILLSTSPTGGYASVSMVELSVLGYPLTPESHDLPADLAGRAGLLAAPYVPRDGMNEHGLAVSTLNVPPTEPRMDPARVTLGRWQVNRLLLDHAKTAEEAVQLLGRFNVSVGDTGAHYFIADALGNSAVVEYPTGAGMTVTRNAAPWQVVTNFFVAGSGRVGFGQDRFDHADQVLKAGQGVLSSDGAMKLLSEVSQSNTVWSAVYNLSNQKVHVAMARSYQAVFSSTCPMATPARENLK